MSTYWCNSCSSGCGTNTCAHCGEFTIPTNPDKGRCYAPAVHQSCEAPDIVFDPNVTADLTPTVNPGGDNPDVWQIVGDCWYDFLPGGSPLNENVSITDCVSAAQA